MPIFDYQCPSCKTIKEARVKSSDDPVECPKCQTVMTKLPSVPCFILKGKDWSSSGSFAKAKNGPYIDPDLLKLSDRELNAECGLPPDLE